MAAPSKKEVSQAIPGLGDMTLDKAEYKRPEDEQDKKLRLHKERVSFYVKDVGAWIFGFLFLATLSYYCFWVLFGSSSVPADKEFAKSIVAPILTALLGFMVGKALK